MAVWDHCSCIISHRIRMTYINIKKLIVCDEAKAVFEQASPDSFKQTNKEQGSVNKFEMFFFLTFLELAPITPSTAITNIIIHLLQDGF